MLRFTVQGLVMAKTEQSIVIDAPIEKVFDIIVDYEKYPEFLPEMRSAQVHSRTDGIAEVTFELEIIMRLGYTLRLVEERPHQVSWTLKAAKMMSANNGGWKLEAMGPSSTRATYGLEIKLRGLIPKSVSTRLTGVTLPNTLQRFKERAEGRA
jgi:ribosome-associated toxin RatA of RatAB toxin-antitoxin module